MPKKETERSQNEPEILVEYGLRRLLIVVGIMLAVLLEILDTTIVNVALPTIQGNLGGTLDESAWIVTGYLIAVIIALPLVPWLESVFGRRRYVVISILGFTAASAACGTAQGIGEIVGFRVLQGLFGGGILTIARSILRDTFPPEQIARSQGLLALGAVVGPSVGPTIGGVLTDEFSWRWIFFVNVMPGVFAAMLLLFVLKEPLRKPVAGDPWGIALMAIGLSSIQYVLQNGERYDWFNDTHIVVITVAGVVFTAAFAWWDLHVAGNPIVDFRILRSRPVAMGVALSFAIGFTLFVGIVLGPQFSQSILGYTATLSGNQVLVRAVSIAAFIPVAVIAMTRLKVRPHLLLAAGFALVGWSGFLTSDVSTSSSAFWSFGWALAIGGFGFGLLFVPLSIAVLSAVKSSESTRVSALLSLFQQLGASFSTALMVTIVDRRSAFHLDHLADGISLERPAVAHFMHAHESVATLAALVSREANALGFADANVAGGVLALAMIPVALFYPSPASRDRSAARTET
jgi:DHA2 family multidrug resistance protein